MRIFVPKFRNLKAHQRGFLRIAGAATPDAIVRADGAGDYTTIQQAINSAPPGIWIQVQANVEGGTQDFSEALDFNGLVGGIGGEIYLQVRPGDTVGISAPTAGDTILRMRGATRYWILDGFAYIGTNSWADVTPIETNNPWDQEQCIRIEDGCNHIELRNFGVAGEGNANKIWGANAYFASQLGRPELTGVASQDGVEFIKVKNCHFELQGHNNNQGSANEDFGDLFNSAAYRVVIEDSTFNRGGHNPLVVEGLYTVVRRCITSNDWRSLGTGADGYRSAALVLEKAGALDDGTGMVLSEYNIHRRSYPGPGGVATSLVKNQARRGVFRYNVHLEGRSRIGMLNDINAGIDGAVTQSKWYHLTHVSVDSIFRQAEPNPGSYTDIFFEESYVNCLFTNLGDGDNADPDTHIYKQDETALGAYPNGWKGLEVRACIFQRDGGGPIEFALNDNTGGWNRQSVANAQTVWPTNFINLYENGVNYDNTTLAASSWDPVEARQAMQISSGANVTLWEALTTMVGGGTNATSGVIADPRFFVLANTHWNLGYFGETDDQILISGQLVRLTSLNKDTGAATWDTPITWVDGAPVSHAPNGELPDRIGAVW